MTTLEKELEVTPANKNEFYMLHKKLIEEQGRQPKWLHRQLDCSYSMLYHYLNGMKYMSLEKVKTLHKILVG